MLVPVDQFDLLPKVLDVRSEQLDFGFKFDRRQVLLGLRVSHSTTGILSRQSNQILSDDAPEQAPRESV